LAPAAGPVAAPAAGPVAAPAAGPVAAPAAGPVAAPAGRPVAAPAVGPVTGTGTSTVEWGPVSRPVEPAGGAWGTLSTVQGQAWPRILSLQQPVITIGRDPTNDLVVPDSQASRQHAQIRRVDGGAVLHDLGSANGTFVNGVRITSPWPIQPGDVIHLGQTELVFETGSQAHQPAGPRYRLVVTRGESVPPDLQLQGKSLFHIGSGQGNDLVIHGDPFVSRQHAQIRQAEHGHEIVDLDSTRGLFVNDKLVSRATLRHGDRIRMGNTELLYQD
jgi:pSer/pThr/pTyr-binding forkhead associated (FHA) protein